MHDQDNLVLWGNRYVIRPLLLEMVRRALPRPPDVDLLQSGVVVQNLQRRREHRVVAIPVSLREREPLQGGKKHKEGQQLLEWFLRRKMK